MGRLSSTSRPDIEIEDHRKVTGSRSSISKMQGLRNNSMKDMSLNPSLRGALDADKHHHPRDKSLHVHHEVKTDPFESELYLLFVLKINEDLMTLLLRLHKAKQPVY